MSDLKSVKALIERQLLQKVDDISIVKLVDLLVSYAYFNRSSDIHLEPTREAVRARFRVDGILHDIFEKIRMSKEIHHEIISRIKVLSGMRTDEHFAPQDGRFRVKLEDGRDIDVRVSIMPTFYGENAVMRLLAETQEFDFDTLGFREVDKSRVQESMKRTHGMILANGPTGSGKTTTLYTLLKQLNRPEVEVITIEDPIEYSMDGATQIQVNNTSGLTFANGLRSILRQDPNIVMVGEIRDAETAAIAVNAALTGHLVLSTLHTNDSATTFPRLIDMGVPPFLVSSTINVAMGQRLVRRLCEKCREERTLSDSEIKSLKEVLPEAQTIMEGKTEAGEVKKFYVAKGCEVCGPTGYTGRIGVREVLEMTDEIRELIMKRGNASEIKAAAMRNGMTTMIQDGFMKAMEGLTTIEEVLRIIHE
jgi:type IV pilus assembly protein PilB